MPWQSMDERVPDSVGSIKSSDGSPMPSTSPGKGKKWIWIEPPPSPSPNTSGKRTAPDDLKPDEPQTPTTPSNSPAIKPEEFKGAGISETGTYNDPNQLLTQARTANQKSAADTLRLSRQADALNNRAYYRPGLGSFGVGQNQVGGQDRGIYQMPTVETAETRAQGRRENYEAAGLSDAMSRARAEFDKNLELRVQNEEFRTFLRLADQNYVAAQAWMQKIAPGAVMPGMMDWIWGNASQAEYQRLKASGLNEQQTAMELFKFNFRAQLNQLVAMGYVGKEKVDEIIKYFTGGN